MKILILDDMEERHEGFKKILSGHELIHAWTFSQAQDFLANDRFGMACLDHDLGDNLSIRPDWQTDMYGSHQLNGADLCYWLRNNPQHCPPKVLVHSWNPDGAESMRRLLCQIDGVQVEVKMFRAP